MATLLDLDLLSPAVSPRALVPREERVTVLASRPSHRPPPTPVRALSRVRGGTYSSTVEVIRFADGSTAHTDLIRLNPNIDAYSLDFAGVSPRQLSHYREISWQDAPLRAAVLWQEEIGRILAAGYPAVPTVELTARLREAGYHTGPGVLREHEAIAATQAAIWRLTNGLVLDTEALDEPVRVRARVGDHPRARAVLRDDVGRLAWHTPLPAGETAYLELDLVAAFQLEAFDLVVGPRTGRHDVGVSLERSLDGVEWSPVSGSRMQVPTGRGTGRRMRRRLGAGATLSHASAAGGERGHHHYRLAATGPADRDGFLDLLDVRLHLAGSGRFRNNERVVNLYDFLLTRATGAAPGVRRVAPAAHAGTVLGPFTLLHAPATVTAVGARVVDGEGSAIVGQVSPGTRFFLRRPVGDTPGGGVEIRVHHQPRARLLIGARTPDGPGAFTPVVALADPPGASVRHRFLISADSSATPQIQ
jgi:TQXA domain-containing protein